jgi:serine/threonine-protein kinase
VKITDFGIALLPSASLTTTGMAVGSPKYMAPEQVLGQKADHRSDIFSLGAVLYEILTGFPPFTGEDLNAILYQVLNGAPPLPSSLNPSLPPGFDRIVARALSKDPDKRYQSASEMASDLRNYKKLPGLLQAAPAAAAKIDTASSAPEHSTATVSAKPSFKRVAVLIPTLLLLLGGGYLWHKQSNSTTSLQVAAAGLPPAGQHTARTQSAPEALATVQASAASEAKSAAPQAQAKPAPKTVRHKTKPQTSAREPEAAPAATPEEKPHVADWKTQLHAQLATCQPLSFFSRTLCREKATWKYCPGHWGSIAECPQVKTSEQ